MATLPNRSEELIRELGGPRWSGKEKTIARKAFKRALEEELNEVVREAKQKSSKIRGPDDLWKLEAYLTRRRQEIDHKYDSRYSRMPMVLAQLVHEGRVTEQELIGLDEDKLRRIR